MALMRKTINFDGNKKLKFLRKAENDDELGPYFRFWYGVHFRTKNREGLVFTLELKIERGE